MTEISQSGSADQTTTTRRRFLKLAICVLASINALVFGIPFIRSLIGVAAKKKAEWSRVTEVGLLPEGQPVEVKFSALTEDVYHYSSVLYSLWVIKHSADRVTVFSPICPHLGCHYLWDSEIERFACPCHASVYSIDGKVLYGPAPRPLDTLPYKIENGVLLVQLERFQVGIPEKVSI